MNEHQRAILQQVAEGRLSPEDAAALLDEAGQDERPEQPGWGDEAGHEEGAEGGAPPGGQSSPSGAGSESAIRRVRVVGSFRSARIIGDPAVREAVADGAHMARREGDLLIIESALDESDLPGFAFDRGRWNWRPTVPPDAAGRGRPRWPGWRSSAGESGQRPWSPSQLTVRMRPDLPLDVDLSAGTVRVHGVTSPMRFDVRAGSVRMEGARGPLDVNVAAGSFRADATLRAGESRVRCDAGSVRINLERGSSVLVRARAELSHLSLPHQDSMGAWAGGERQEVRIGDGAATLDIEANLSSVAVTADR
ncbi:MAG TPA: hypothetical protein VFA45_14755 [Actinomycetes bacterium]|jgi:hypothetical protein|nr:hypothetical protein [Actinomycetes bacterium]